MNEQHYAMLHMFEAVASTLERNREAWHSMPAFESAVGRFENSVHLLAGLTKWNDQPSNAIPADRQLLKTILIVRLAELADAVVLFASATGNATLAGQMRMAPARLSEMTDAALLEKSVEVRDFAVNLMAGNTAEMNGYGVTAERIGLLDNAIAGFAAMLGGVYLKMAETKVTMKGIDREIAVTERILKEQLDKFMMRFEATAPEFVADYRSVRQIAAAEAGMAAMA